MSMLDRYRKSGGFYQLVSLVETCPPAKQEKFLEIIRSESQSWADAVKTKMLDAPRIFSWRDETLSEIFGTLQDLTIAIILHAASEDLKRRIYATMTPSRKRKVDDLFETSKPTPGEIATMHIKLVETVRKMAHDGYLRFDKIDPDLYFDEKIEEVLNRVQPFAASSTANSTASAPSNVKSEFTIEYDASHEHESAGHTTHGVVSGAPSQTSASVDSLELASLRKKITELSKENSVLRHELSVAKNKLEQIKKIA